VHGGWIVTGELEGWHFQVDVIAGGDPHQCAYTSR
jgi:hypothetical protein